jgi:hypothetical protein
VSFSTETLHLLSACTLVAFVGLAGFDTSYYHLHKARLFDHPASRLEHLVHGVRALLMSVSLLTFFDPGVCLRVFAAGAFAVVVDLAIQLWDMAIERRSRAHLGGLSSPEYVLHNVATILHVLAICLTVAARVSLGDGAPPAWLHWICLALALGTFITFVQHLYLLYPRRRGALLEPRSNA